MAAITTLWLMASVLGQPLITTVGNEIIIRLPDATKDVQLLKPATPPIRLAEAITALQSQVAALMSQNAAYQIQMANMSSTIAAQASAMNQSPGNPPTSPPANGGNPAVSQLTGRINALTASVARQNATLNSLSASLLPTPTFNKLRVGNSILNWFSTALPYQRIEQTLDTRCTRGTDAQFPFGNLGGGSGCGYADTPFLSLQTNFNCGNTSVNIMYHLQFEGHLFRDAESFACKAVGYVNAGNLVFHHEQCDNDFTSNSNAPMQLLAYCGVTTNALVFRLYDPNYAADRWHASDLVINYVGGGGSYIQRGTAMAVIDAAHHLANYTF